MKQSSIRFLQGVIGLFGVGVLAIMVRFPLYEGRAVDLDLFSIYADPFILYGYAGSTPFFIALYKAFILLGFIGKGNAFSIDTVRALRIIKYCGIVLSILILFAGLYIKIFHHKDDDPAPFLAMCMVTAFVSLVVVIATTVFENILQNGLKIKSENEQLYEQFKK